jgi:hypothetical protein
MRKQQEAEAVDDLAGGHGPFESRATEFQILNQISCITVSRSSKQNTPRSRQRRAIQQTTIRPV